MDKLTLEHLSPYLPYGLKMQVDTANKGTYLQVMNTVNIKDLLKYTNNVKPIIRPLSEITVDFFKENIDDAIIDFLINCEPEHNHFSVEVCDKHIGWTALSYEEYQSFFKNHYDVFGLIEKGLAIDINTLGKEVKDANN